MAEQKTTPIIRKRKSGPSLTQSRLYVQIFVKNNITWPTIGIIKNVRNEATNNLRNLLSEGFSLTVKTAANTIRPIVNINNISEVEVVKGKFGNMISRSPPISPQKNPVVQA